MDQVRANAKWFNGLKESANKAEVSIDKALGDLETAMKDWWNERGYGFTLPEAGQKPFEPSAPWKNAYYWLGTGLIVGEGVIAYKLWKHRRDSIT